MKPGKYVSECTIPKNLLNNINYQIDIHVDIPGIKRVFQYNGEINFNTYGNANNGSDFNEKVPGLFHQ